MRINTGELDQLTEFRIVIGSDEIVHLIFDCPNRSMNVFSEKATNDLLDFAEWLRGTPVRGVVVRSGKKSGFCAGGDLVELAEGFDRLMRAPPSDRLKMGCEHFGKLSRALRKLEAAGKPVASAISGVALGGGCELALATHYRVAAKAKRTLLGLPECGVGLLPGAGGTQRLPRAVDFGFALDLLVKGRMATAETALVAGLVDDVVDEGQEVEVAQAWLLSDAATCVQPWERESYSAPCRAQQLELVELYRAEQLARMLGHEPSPLAILDCIRTGMLQEFDDALETEIEEFAKLIQRRESRNMIRTCFLGKQALEKAERDNTLNDTVRSSCEAILRAAHLALAENPALARALVGTANPPSDLLPVCIGDDYWIARNPKLLAAVEPIIKACDAALATLSPLEQLQLDYAVVRAGAIPAYLGGASGFVAMRQ